jgi:hypothetical protein
MGNGPWETHPTRPVRLFPFRKVAELSMELERSFHRTCSQAPGEELAGNAGPQAIRYFASLKKRDTNSESLG